MGKMKNYLPDFQTQGVKVCTLVGTDDGIIMNNHYFLLVKIIVCLLCAGLIGCASFPTAQNRETTGKKSPPREINEPDTDPNAPFKISNVTIHPKFFNPEKGESITISYSVTKSSRAIVQIFDPDNHLVRELIPDDTGDPGNTGVFWDGRDMDGNVVPDEAYYFTIEANEYGGGLTHYDPLTFSGGKNISFPVNYDKAKKTITYELPEDARLIIRGGITRGPMLRNFVNWQPKPIGLNEELWDGKDDSGAIHVAEKKGFIIMSEGVTLPENSIITSGNNEHSYLEYKRNITLERPEKENRPRIAVENTQENMQQFVHPAHKGVSISFRMEVPSEDETANDNLPIVKGLVPVKIIIDDRVKRFVTEQRYEIINYVDFQFVTEQEEGYSPCVWMWDSNTVKNGEHILTVNIATLTGNLATSSLKVFVNN